MYGLSNDSGQCTKVERAIVLERANLTLCGPLVTTYGWTTRQHTVVTRHMGTQLKSHLAKKCERKSVASNADASAAPLRDLLVGESRDGVPLN